MSENASLNYVAIKCPQCGAAIQILEEMVKCQYCGTHLLQQRPKDASSKTVPGTVSKGMKFSTHICQDTQGTGLDAFRMLIPSGWQFQGGVYWLQDNPGMPSVLAFQVANPSGCEAFEVFPNQPFYWTNNPMALMTFPIGSRYYGNEVRPPMDPQQSLRQIVLPRFRSSIQPEIIKEEHLPDLPAQVRTTPVDPRIPLMADGARIRIRYLLKDEPIEEEIYGVVEVTRNMTPTMMGMMEMIFWFADYLFAFRARAGQLDSSSDLFRTILTSFQLNQVWFARVQQISQYLIQNQIQQIHNVGQISQFISQTYNQMSQANLSSYYQRSEGTSNSSARFSQNLRGVEDFVDPNSGQNIELPSGYTQAWSNPSGEYIVSDNPNFNPNLETDQNWTQLSRKDPDNSRHSYLLAFVRKSFEWVEYNQPDYG